MESSFCPELPKTTLVLKKDTNKFLFLIPEKPDWIVVNENLAKALRLCDGKHSLSTIKNILLNHPKGEEGVKILDKLIKDNFFTQNTQNNIHHPYILSSLHLNMTDKCNLKCKYCYAEDRVTVESNVSYDTYINVIDDAYSINKDLQVTFTGGEPLLNKKTIKLAEYCTSKNIETYLLTNGIPITKRNVERIANNFGTIRISIDGADPISHDQLRGKGSYAKAMKGIALLEEAGKSPLIAMTVTNWNIDEIQPMADKYGSRLTYQPLYQVGRARNSSLHIEGMEYYNALKNASGVQPYSQLGEKLQRLKNSGCHKCAFGDGEISIGPSGNVYPCHLLHADEFCAGNINNDSFLNIYKNSEVLKKIRTYSVEKREGCKSCPVRFLCGGGCWARAYLRFGDINVADEFCDYELSALISGLLDSAEA